MALFTFCPACPNPNDLVNIDDMTCPINWSEIDRIIFQRTTAAAITKVNAALIGTWTTLFALADADPDKAVITPRNSLMEFKPEATNWIKAITNSDGVETIQGVEPTSFKGKFTNLDTATEAAIRKLMCNVDLKAYFVNTQNQILGVSSGLNLDGFSIINGTIGEMPLQAESLSYGIGIATFPFEFTLNDRFWSESRFYINTTFAKSMTA